MTVLLLSAALALPVGAGVLVTRPLAGRDAPGSAVLRGALAAGLGLGLASLLFFVLLVGFGRAGAGMLAAEGLAMVLLLVFFRNRLRPRRGALPRLPATYRLATLAAGGAAVMAAVAFVLRSLNHALGGWDAWAFWNMRARFLTAGAAWPRGFSEAIGWSSPDYPLLLPASVARVWTYLGGPDPIGPAAVAFVFTFATLGVLWGALRMLRGPAHALAGSLLLLATAYFVRHGAAQYADVPLGFFFLTALALLVVFEEAPGEGGRQRLAYAALAGLAAGLAAWTKNEGLLFLACLVAARLFAAWLPGRERGAPLRRGLRAFVLGIAPALLILVYFKLALAPPNNFVAAQALEATTDRITDPGRSAAISRSLLRTVLHQDGLVALLLPACAALFGVRLQALRHTGVRTAVLTLVLMLGAYFVVFLVTPADLTWHLSVALKRLLLQLWPSTIFVAMLLLRFPASE